MKSWWWRHSWLTALIFGIVGYLAILAVLLLTRNTTMIPALLLVGAATVPLTVLLWAIQDRQGNDLVPWPLVLASVLGGGVVGIIGAGLFEGIAASAMGASSMYLVGVIEETVKLVVPLILLSRSYEVTRRGGVVIGIAVGSGFAVLETMGYGFNGLLGQGGGLGAVDSTLLLRGLLAPAGHIAWTGLICAALWYFRSRRGHLIGLLAVLGSYALAIVMHTLWDNAASIPVHVVIAAVSIIGLVALVVAAHRSGAGERTPAPAPTAEN